MLRRSEGAPDVSAAYVSNHRREWPAGGRVPKTGGQAEILQTGNVMLVGVTKKYIFYTDPYPSTTVWRIVK
jgi:hypothetical protein